MLRRTVIYNKLKQCGLVPPKCDQKLYLRRNGNSFIILLLVVDYIAFALYDHTLFSQFQNQIEGPFDVKVYTVSVLSRHLRPPTPTHLQHARRIMRYISSITHLGFPCNTIIQPLRLFLCVHADWSGDVETCRSTIRVIFTVNATPVDRRSKRQTFTAFSSRDT